MNTKNNKRRRASIERIEKSFIELLQQKDIDNITVSEICALSEINRSTFYANFLDIYDLAQKVVTRIWEDFLSIYLDDLNDRHARLDFTKLFTYVRDNQILFKTYFKLGNFDLGIVGYDKEVADLFFDKAHLEYHIEFFKHGFNAILKKWLNDGCKEPPEEMQQILNEEYRRDYSLLN